jgi:hypothetical protein
LDAKEIMHQTWLDVIKFNRPRGFKQNWNRTSTSMHKDKI